MPRDLSNPLMDLRILTLRLIAEVWKIELGDNPDRKMRENVLTKHDALQKHIKENPNLGEFPFENLGFRFINNSTASWNDESKTWKKPFGESITICLPSWTGSDLLKSAEKITEYYDYFPTFLGLTTQLAGYTTEWVGGIPSNNYDLGVSPENFLSFGAVVLKIIARAQQDASFRDRIDYLKANAMLGNKYKQDIFYILATEFDFTNPWAFDIRFVFSAPDESIYASDGYATKEQALDVSLQPFWNDSGKWKNGSLIRTMVELELPTPPNDAGQALEALAAYNSIGPKYPFTCS